MLYHSFKHRNELINLKNNKANHIGILAILHFKTHIKLIDDVIYHIKA